MRILIDLQVGHGLDSGELDSIVSISREQRNRAQQCGLGGARKPVEQLRRMPW